jgi:hypothetical protein
VITASSDGDSILKYIFGRYHPVRVYKDWLVSNIVNCRVISIAAVECIQGNSHELNYLFQLLLIQDLETSFFCDLSRRISKSQWYH